MNTGIILKTGFKTTLENEILKEGEIVISTDTKEIGIFINNEIIWLDKELIDIEQIVYSVKDFPSEQEPDAMRYIVFYPQSKLFFKQGDVFSLFDGASRIEVYDSLELNYHNKNDFPYLGKYSNDMAQDYSSEDNEDVSINEDLIPIETSLENIGGIKQYDELPEGYSPTKDNQVLTVKDFKEKQRFFVPDFNPGISGALWNDNGILKLS